MKTQFFKLSSAICILFFLLMINSCKKDDDTSGFNCVNGMCESVSSDATYSNLSACQSSCAVSTSGYDCINGDCESVSSDATYGTLTDCQSSCGSSSGCDGTTFTDPRDGQTYQIVQIGNQCWFAENLNYETGNSWCYDNDPANCANYGRLYDWQTAITACPPGWHLPSDAEWFTMENYVDSTINDPNATGWRGTDGGKKLKATSGWNQGGNGTDEFGFAGLPGGFRGSHDFYSIGSEGHWWSSTEYDTDFAWNRTLFYNVDSVGRHYSLPKPVGRSCRCVKD